jgi:2'-5' RNA ligase
MDNNLIRCFVAFDFPSEAKEHIRSVIESNQKRFPHARWVSINHIHITLQFFPALSVSQINQVRMILQEIALPLSAFGFTLQQLGAFSSWKRVRVLWIGVDDHSSEMMKKIAFLLKKGCSTGGIEIEDETREFSPHITLARFKNPTAIQPEQLIQPSFYTTQIRQLSFYQSTLTPQGPIYTPLDIFTLKEVK